MTILLTFPFLVLLAAFMLFHLRVVLRDTCHIVLLGARRAHQEGRVFPWLAFAGLWVMIFSLAYV